MRKIKILLLLFMLPAAGFTQKTVTAASIIASINKNEPVNLTDAQVTGDLDFTRLANMKAESQNSSEKVYISTVNSAISFNNCSFTGKVLGYFNPDIGKPFYNSNSVYNANFNADVSFQNCTFEKEAAFKYSIFSAKISFAGSKFNDD